LTSQTESGLIPELGATLCPHPFSALNEIRAMEVLQVSVLIQLQKYSSSLDDDEALLKQSVEDFLSTKLGNIPRKAQYYNIRNAIIARRGEKRVLQHFLNLSCICLDFLSQVIKGEETFEDYIELLESELMNAAPLLAPPI
jgi:hypothetical protein